jgi:hypothetical protein
MGWDSKLSYPLDALRTVTVKATDGQKAKWQYEAKRHGMASAGAFLAFAGDLYIALHRAWEDAVHEHDEALNPVGPVEEERRRREREAARLEREGER